MNIRFNEVRRSHIRSMVSVAASLAAAQPLAAAVISFDLDPQLSYQVGGATYVTRTDQVRSIDLVSSTYSTAASGNGFTVSMTNSPAGMLPGPVPMFVPGSYEIYLRPGTGTEIMMASGVSGSLAYQYTAGAMIGPGSFSSLEYNQYGTTTATWASSFYNYISKSGSFATGGWATTGTDYVGIRIKSGEEAYHYGWLEVQRSMTSAPYPYTITRFAVEDSPNTPIQAGSLSAVPEPSSVLLSMVGVAMLFRRRRGVD